MTDQITYRCAQCGRSGTRLFDVLPVPGGIPIVICAVKTACRKRWPKPARDDD